MSFAAIAGPVAGAVVGGLMSDGGGGGQQVSKEPWAEAAPWLKETLRTGQQLQNYYQQNPFNPMQQTGYQNTFTDLDVFRGQNNGLMQFANQLMGKQYQRGQAPSGGLLSMQQPAQTMQAPPQGLLAPNVFSIPQGQQYGQANWKELNPWTATNGIPSTPVAEKPTDKSPEDLARDEWERRRISGEGYRGEGA